MSKLLEMIKTAKVEWKPLGEVAKIQRGASPRPIAKYITEDKDGVPWIKIGDTSPQEKYINNTAQKITKEGALKSRMLQKGDFIISNSMSFGRPYILGINGAIHDGWASLSKFQKVLNPDFLYYYLASNKVKNYWLGKINSGSVSNLNSDIISQLTIPIPPLPIQAEIVRILDNFTELTAELTAREKQYNYYRDLLLSETELAKTGFEWKTLGEVAEIGTGSHDTQDAIDDGSYIFYARGREPLRLNIFDFDEIAIITAGDGVGVGKVFHYVQGKYALHQRAYRIFPNELVKPKFAYYYITAYFYQYIQKVSVNSSVTSLRKPMLLNFPITIPPIPEQERIVAILDKFDALNHSISEGLPREIELRQKRYEYYRELLLNFPKPL
ncbi:MAG: restriction endonuclease subunit S [Neisseria sp.]|uniref:restriction endonuclease subunit S n=1 Tax=Neisseria sp. TaxID=192066 RepID=UPI0026DC0981|nr:restriction endonuclease subunit S [Neisseria sp.]MDO4641458.1 restriction endonuclease subunit S [Neisseria sp.]